MTIIRDGKLFVGLQQLVTGFASADGTYVLVIDTATDQVEKIISDPRTASPGRYGNIAPTSAVGYIELL